MWVTIIRDRVEFIHLHMYCTRYDTQGPPCYQLKSPAGSARYDRQLSINKRYVEVEGERIPLIIAHGYQRLGKGIVKGYEINKSDKFLVNQIRGYYLNWTLIHTARSRAAF